MKRWIRLGRKIRSEYFDVRDSKFRLQSLDDYDETKKINLARCAKNQITICSKPGDE